MTEQEYYKEVRRELEEYAALKFNVKILNKQDSWIMKIFSWILFFNKSFMTSYVTTFGNRIYFPADILTNDKVFTEILAHELVHVQDGRGWKYPFFALGYLFPQVLAVFSMLAFFHSWFWLLCLLFLLPIPAPFRTYLEMRGYIMTLNIIRWNNPTNLPQSREQLEHLLSFITNQFTTSAYYFMWPFKSHIFNLLEKKHLEQIIEIDVLLPFQEYKDQLALDIWSITNKYKYKFKYERKNK